VRSHALAAFENVPLWHERDISHSSVERVIGPDSTILVDFMLSRFSTMVDQLVVYPEEMEKNIQITKGIFFSQAIMLKLIKRGLSREDAYLMVQKIALKSWDKGENFRETIDKDVNIKKYLPIKEIEQCCNMKHYLKNIDEIFLRVFGNKG
jgi:adenylosuccinate lyase